MAETIFSSSETYHSSLISGDHGTLFQKNLFLILFERLTRNGYDFKLAYEMTDGEKFDDVVVFLKDPQSGNDESWFFQAKHKDTPTSGCQPSPIKYEMLFPKDAERLEGDFNLCKYLVSYSVMKRKFQQKMKVFVFTNRDLLLEDFNARNVTISPKGIERILDFSGRNLGLVMKDETVKQILNNVNREFFLLKDAIVKLFKSGIVDSILPKYKSPLADDVLEKSQNIVSFKSTFAAKSNKKEVNKLYEAIREIEDDIKTAQLILDEENNANNQIGIIFSGKSRNKTLPTLIDEETVREFFDDLVLSVNQPNDLRSIISDDLQEWMKTWLRPEYFGKLDRARLQMPLNAFEELFGKLNEKKEHKPFLTQFDGVQCLAKIKAAKIFKQIEFCPFYINRRIELVGNKSSVQLSDMEFAKELTGKFNNQKLFILSAEPGMGKTTVFQYIAYMAQQVSNRFVYLVYLNDFQRVLRDIESISDAEDVLLAFSGVFSEAHCENVKNTFCGDDKRNRQIIMFFDAFDEIAIEERAKVLKIFEQLQTIPNIQVVVGGRRHVKELLEKQFMVNAMSLVPFDHKDQVIFLRKIWNVSECDEVVFHKYATHLLNLFHTAENRALYKFTGLPLTLKMLAEVKKDSFEEYLRSSGNNEICLSIQKVVGIVDLYEMFTEKHFNAKMEKLSHNWCLEARDYIGSLERFKLQHQLLAIDTLKIFWQKVMESVFGKSEAIELLGYLNSPAFKTEYDDFLERIRKQTDKSSLVEFVDNQIQFVHLSYAEFFVAQFIYSHIEILQRDIFDFTSDYMENNPFNCWYSIMIRRFFFAMLETNQDPKYLDILREPFEQHAEIRNWILEAFGCNTIKEMLKDAEGNLKYALAHEVLIEAAQENFYEVCKFMIETYGNDLNVNYMGSSGGTALSVAAENGCTEAVELLIEKNADINLINRSGKTPFQLAFSNYHPSVLKLLINNNASWEAEDPLRQTPFHVTISLIKEYNFKITHLTASECKSNNDEIISYNDETMQYNNKIDILYKMLEIMTEKPYDINATYKHGKTILHHASAEGVKKAVSLLLSHSPNLNAQDKNKQTPLHIATLNNHFDVVKLLLEKSADVNVADKQGLTPLHIAARDGFTDAVKLLLDHNANFSARNANGQTPLCLAKLSGQAEVEEMLGQQSILFQS